ncbi:MAG: hypothetical protein L6R39_001457 [Caloplaca ligustica]|nr:MAG: hypothetical protein L6R39_001457 [Caloplaca ligustica]
MVFKPFTHLARQSLGKTLTHGYAQSVVAATQSSYASTTTPFGPFSTHAANKFSKHGSSQLHSTFQYPSTPSGATPSYGQSSVPEGARGDGGLAAYYEAWQKQQRSNAGGKEWKQFQFPLRIGWRAPSTLPDAKEADKDNAARLRPDALLDRSGLNRAYSTSAVDDIKEAENVATEAANLAAVDDAIAKEISTFQATPTLIATSPAPAVSVVDTPLEQQSGCVVDISPSTRPESINTISSSQDSRPLTDDTVPTAYSLTPTDEILRLREDGRFAEIPAVFESMLARGIQPSMEAYNGLLSAAIALPAPRHHVVSKALQIYTDVLRRRVTPDTVFYTALLDLLSRRAIEVYQAKKAMNIKRSRFGIVNLDSSFLLPSDDSEFAILLADDALRHAVTVFNAAISTSQGQSFSSELYDLLITACALHGRDEDMIRIHTHMEENQVVPTASMFPPVIEAFARTGDLRSAIECYGGYRSMAMQHDAGHNSLIGRYDYSVYATVVKSFLKCGRSEGGYHFMEKILNSFDSGTEAGKARLEAAQDIIVVDGLIQHQIDIHQFEKALNLAESRNLTPSARNKVLARICSVAADQGDRTTAIKSYNSLEPTFPDMSMVALSLLAMEIRSGRLDEACNFWPILCGHSNRQVSLLEPTTMYTIALIKHGQIDEGMILAREAFARIRTSVGTATAREQAKEKIDEVIELIGKSLDVPHNVPSPQAAVTLLGAMTENNGPVSPVSEQLLAGLGSAEISALSWQDVLLVLRIEAAMISGGTFLQDMGHVARFEHLLHTVIQRGLTLDEITSEHVERALSSLGDQRPDIAANWRHPRHMASQSQVASMVGSPAPSLALNAPASYTDAYDPYAATIDHRDSNIIVAVLDNTRSRRSVNLDEALARFRNMRRGGRRPRYIVYSKLINAAALEDRADVIVDLLGAARQDVPLQSQYPSVREGWSSILDSVIGACLTVGNRAAASAYHQELLELGSVPSANTYGLYITTLKESAQTLDEANEALDIFSRAMKEGVEPTSFLYNALIGKLGKARRIEEASSYFAQMQRRGLRPTSVSYGTMINAMCRVSDERHAESLFDEMEKAPNYKPRPAPYNSVMQYFQTTKRDGQKVLEYYSRMLSKKIQPTMHTYKLLIDTYATLEPVNMPAAEGVLGMIRASGQRPEAVHYASLVHAKGCVLHDMAGAWETFNAATANPEIRPHACLYQALFESMVANHQIEGIEGLLGDMTCRGVEMTPYVANTIIHGWANAENIAKARDLYKSLKIAKREPSTYEAMTRAFLAVHDREHAREVVDVMLSRGYPAPVTRKIQALLDHAGSRAMTAGPTHPAA